MKNAEYWRKRMELLMEAEMMEAEEFEKEVRRAYNEAARSMQQDIEIWYARFAKNNQVSLAEARKMLRKQELEELRWTLEEYIRHGQENGISADWAKQLENASARVHISRLESLQIQCYEHVHEVTGSLTSGLRGLLIRIFRDGFYRTIFEYQKAEGDSDPFARLNADRVDRILKNPWSRDGTEFSERIWRERDKLVKELHTGLTQGMIRGDPLEKMIKHVMERFDVSRANASRIVRTESAVFAVLSQRDALRELGVKEYEVCGTLDGKTCTICGEMDKKVFPMSLFETGVTAPVFHPNCRCCISPHVKEEIPGRRAARGPDGKTYYVPSDMNYSEWKRKYVDNDPVDQSAKSGTIEPSQTNGGNPDVHVIGKIDRRIYQAVTPDITTDTVIITEQQIAHIKERHPNDFERYAGYIPRVLADPDYILEANKPDTAFVLKRIQENKENFQVILRLKTSKDPKEYKNSIITFLKIRDKEFERLIRNKKILYKKE